MIANRTLRVLGKTIFAGETLPDIPEEQKERLIKAGSVSVPQPEEEPVVKPPRKTTRRKKKTTEEVTK